MRAAIKAGVQRYSGAIRSRILETARADLDAALALAGYYGALLHHNHIGVYADPELERELGVAAESLGIGREVRQSGRGVLHLATEVYPWGGHTRVIERLVEAGLGDAVATLSPVPAPVQAALRDRCRVTGPLEGSDRVETLRRIVAAGGEYAVVVLHIHPFDITSAIAAGILARVGIRILLYNHADHGFGFGFPWAERILELSKYGWAKAHDRQIQGRQAYVGIPVASPSLPAGIARKSRRLLTSGWSPKFRPFNDVNAASFVEAVVDRVPGDVQFDVVGPRGHDEPFRRLGKRARRCVRFHGLVSHEQFARLLAECGAYVDSFPQGNGTGFVEALLSGAPCFGLDLLAGCSPADALRSHSPAELVERVVAFLLDPSDAGGQFAHARALARTHQSPAACVSRIRAILDRGVCESLPPELESARCMMDFYERYWEAAGQVVLVPRAAAALTASARTWLLGRALRDLEGTGLIELGKLAWVCLSGAVPART